MHHCDTSDLWSTCADHVDCIKSCRVQVVHVPEEVHGVDSISSCQHSPDECRLNLEALSCSEGFLGFFFWRVTLLEAFELFSSEHVSEIVAAVAALQEIDELLENQ